MASVSLVLYAVIAIASLVVFYFKNLFGYWKKKNIPHKETNSLYGIFADLRGNTGFYELISKIYDDFKGTGPFVGVHSFSLPSVVLLDLDLIKNVLIKDFHNFDDRGLFYNERDDPLTAHLFALDAAKWRPLRGKLTPTFTSGKMKFMFPTIVSVGEHFIVALDKEIKANNEIEVRDILARFTTDVIGTCAFGIECNSLNDPNVLFRQMGKKVFTYPRSKHYILFTEMFPKLARFLRLKRTPPGMTLFFSKIVTDTVDYREKNKIRRNDFMDLLIDLKNAKSIDSKDKAMTITEIITQSFVFFVAGFETSSTSMGFTLYELAQNPHIQDKLRMEITDTLSKYDNELTYEGMKEMHYLDQVINESLRKYPPGVHLKRIANADYPTSDPKYTIPKNSAVFIPVFGIHRDPEIYPNPDVFDPDRFSPEETKKRHPMAFLPFGDGPRNCIGLRFGKMQAQIGLAMLIKNFKFSVAKDTLTPMRFHKTNIVLSSDRGIVLKVERI